MIRLLLVFASLALPSGAETLSCANASNQMDLTKCAFDDWKAADADLNAAYQQVMTRLKAQDAELSDSQKGGPEALRDAQRAWITFRDKTCEAEGFAMRGGSAEPMVVGFCLGRLTRERTSHLAGMRDAYGG
jgi:uncharacterized protein YecT (DUF1311 family)